MLDGVAKTVDRTTKVMLKTPSCISRMERTGVVSTETAQVLGAVGMAARSSGVDIDTRFDFNDNGIPLLMLLNLLKQQVMCIQDLNSAIKRLNNLCRLLKTFRQA